MKKTKNYQKWIIRGVLLFFDYLLINVSAWSALLIRVNFQYNTIGLEVFQDLIFYMLIPNTIVTLLLIALFRLHNNLWKYISVYELLNIVAVSFISSAFGLLFCLLVYKKADLNYFIFYFLLLFVFLSASRFGYRIMTNMAVSRTDKAGQRNTMVIGAGEGGCLALNELRFSDKLKADVKCIIDDDIKKQGKYFRGVKVVGGRESIVYYAQKYDINEIIIAIPSASKKEVEKIANICMEVKNCELKILPGLYQLIDGSVSVSKIRDLKIDDLLGREKVELLDGNLTAHICEKTVLVTGGGGSIGSELCRQIALNGVGHLVILDIYENNVYDLQQELIKCFPNLKMTVLIGSVRNRGRIQSIFKSYRPDIVYHAAAHKHVPLMEDSPNEAVKNNVFGTYEVALAAHMYKTKKFVLISTDKAVNPTNVMGATKRICEMVVQFFGQMSQKTEYCAVRFGNVLGSNGSVIPLFRRQIEQGGPLTITHPEIIRYFMTIEEAVSLVLRAGTMDKGGAVFVLDMGNPVKIIDLAEKMIKLCGYEPYKDIDIKFIGLRPGEKLYEEPLMDSDHLRKTEDSKIFIESFAGELLHDFADRLKVLYESAYNESTDIRKLIGELVDTYTPPLHLCGGGIDLDGDSDVAFAPHSWDSYLDKL